MRTKVFDFTRPLTYKGSHYPSTIMDIEDDKGNVASRNVFADANGQYYSLNNDGNAVPIILINNLDEVTVTASKRKGNTPAEFGQYLKNYYTSPSVNSSDNTRVLNTSHREYNPHLKDAALRGAKSNALWEKEHPNATAWRDDLGSIPFVVAAAPALMGAGEAWTGTTLGQGVANGLGILANIAKNSTFLPWLDAAATSYFGAKGLQDVKNGNFTPETAMEVAPLVQMAESMYNVGKGIANISKTHSLNKEPSFVSELDWSPESWFGTRNGKIGYDAEDIAALNSHIPEYHNIEKQTKANGTWLKMPDGSIWEGDPRTWVQMMSKSYDRYTGNSPFKYTPFAHSTEDAFDTFDISHFGKTDEGFYGRGFYTHPAENINGQLVGRNSYGDNNYLLTTNVQKPLDLRSTDFKYAELFNRENTNASKGIFDIYDSVYYGVLGKKMVGASPSELVVPEPSNYKSLLGNNGDFNPLNPNMYKVLVPFGVSTMAMKYHSQDK